MIPLKFYFPPSICLNSFCWKEYHSEILIFFAHAHSKGDETKVPLCKSYKTTRRDVALPQWSKDDIHIEILPLASKSCKLSCDLLKTLKSRVPGECRESVAHNNRSETTARTSYELYILIQILNIYYIYNIITLFLCGKSL